ncbi:hypothetical protein BH09ACT6_BH09ACT6_06030 [soil metagenome]
MPAPFWSPSTCSEYPWLTGHRLRVPRGLNFWLAGQGAPRGQRAPPAPVGRAAAVAFIGRAAAVAFIGHAAVVAFIERAACLFHAVLPTAAAPRR